MPIYEYLCTKCNKKFEMRQSISAEPLKTCIACGGKVKKLISSSSIQFKGSGFYINDYKNRSVDSSPEKKSCSTVQKEKKDVA
jgi:putative FmdB family regulatory protein